MNFFMMAAVRSCAMSKTILSLFKVMEIISTMTAIKAHCMRFGGEQVMMVKNNQPSTRPGFKTMIAESYAHIMWNIHKKKC